MRMGDDDRVTAPGIGVLPVHPVEIEAAVMFTDIVGFTRWSEEQSPQHVLERLSRVFARVEELINANRGTLCAFLGDGAMAVFASASNAPSHAADALACAIAIADEFAAWNRRRIGRGAPIRISVGLHVGPVVVASLDRRRPSELTVLGDTVNVAQRLEGLTREVPCEVAVSTAVVDRAGLCSGPQREIAERLTAIGRRKLRGRNGPVDVWTYSSGAAASARCAPVRLRPAERAEAPRSGVLG